MAKAGQSWQKPKVKSEVLPAEASKSLQDWLDQQWDKNCRYGERTVQLLTEIAEKFYKIGRESKE